MRAFHSLLTVGLIVFGCVSSDVLGQQVLPRVKAPVLDAQPTPTPPAIQDSIIDVPVTVSFQDVFSRAEQTIPREVDNSETWLRQGGKGIKYRFWRDPISTSLSGQTITFGFNGYYWIRSVKGLNRPWPLSALIKLFTAESCGRAKRPWPMITEYKTEFELGEGWGLVSRTHYDVRNVRPCPITFFGADPTYKVRASFEPKVVEAAAAITGKLNSTTFRPVAEAAWQKLSEPVQVASPDVWMVFDPIGMRVASVAGYGDSLATTVGIIARPKVTYEGRPGQAIKPAPSNRTTSSSSGFHLMYESPLPFDHATEALEDTVVGKEYRAEGNAAQITAVVVSAFGENAVLKVRTTGSLRGTIYLAGKIITNTADNVVSVTDLKFTEETMKTLTNSSATWLQNTTLVQDLVGAAKWALDEQMKDAKDKVIKAVNRPLAGDATLSGSVSTQSVATVYGRGDAFIVRIISNGTATLVFK